MLALVRPPTANKVLYGAKAAQSSVVGLVSGLRQFVIGVAQLGYCVTATPQRGHYGGAVAGVFADCKAAVNPMLLACRELADQALCIGHLEGPGFVRWRHRLRTTTLCQRLSEGAEQQKLKPNIGKWMSSVAVTDMSSTACGIIREHHGTRAGGPQRDLSPILILRLHPLQTSPKSQSRPKLKAVQMHGESRPFKVSIHRVAFLPQSQGRVCLLYTSPSPRDS